MKTLNKAPRAARGFLSIEAMVVLVIVIGLMSLAASKMGLLGSNSDIIEEISNVQSLYTGARAIRGSNGYGAANTNLVASLVATGNYPSNIARDAANNTMTNKWGGALSIAANGAGGFTISTASVPPAECITLASKISRAGTFRTTQINNSAAVANAIDVPTATAQCNVAANTIVFNTAS